MKKVLDDFKGVEMMESWLDNKLVDVANGKVSGLADLLRKDTNKPLEDLGVKVVMFSGIPMQYLGNMIDYFEQGIKQYYEGIEELAPLIAFSCAVPNA